MSAPSTPQDHPGGLLFKFPAELRLKIYESMFPPDEIEVFSFRNDLSKFQTQISLRDSTWHCLRHAVQSTTKLSRCSTTTQNLPSIVLGTRPLALRLLQKPCKTNTRAWYGPRGHRFRTRTRIQRSQCGMDRMIRIMPSSSGRNSPSYNRLG
jgi:hypothetical protein